MASPWSLGRLGRAFSSLLFYDDETDVPVRALQVELDANAPPSKAALPLMTSSQVFEAEVCEAILCKSIAQAESEALKLSEKLAAVEDEWSAKVAEFMQRNAQLRVDAKSATRRVAVLDAELETARKRIAELEKALTDVALDSNSHHDLELDRGTPIANMGTDRGDIFLGLSPSAHSASKSLSLASPAPSLNRGTPSHTLQADSQRGKGSLQESPRVGQSVQVHDQHHGPAASMPTPPNSGGCCLVS